MISTANYRFTEDSKGGVLRVGCLSVSSETIGFTDFIHAIATHVTT